MIKPKKEIIYHETGKDALFKTWHSSDAVTILFVHSGSGSIVCSEKTYPIKPGVLCLIGRGKFHYTMPDNPAEYERSKLFIENEHFQKILSLISDKGLNFENREFVYALIDKTDIKNAEDIFDRLSSVAAFDSGYKNAFITSAALMLLVYLDKYMTEKSRCAPGVMARAIEYINNNISDDITIDKICDFLHISKYYFCRQFKKTTGLTVMNYILKTRITLAKDMLLKDEYSVTEVSMKCGFSSVSYFCRVFKEDCGITPLKFKNKV